jgi:hypothetical protein
LVFSNAKLPIESHAKLCPEVTSWSFVTQIFHNGQPSHGGDRKIFEVMTSTLPKGTLGSVASLLAATLYHRVLWIVVCPFVLFLLAIVLSVLLRYTDSDYHFGISKLFLLLIYIVSFIYQYWNVYEGCSTNLSCEVN